MPETEEQRRARKAKERAERHNKERASELKRREVELNDEETNANKTKDAATKEELKTNHSKDKEVTRSESKEERKARKERERALKETKEKELQSKESKVVNMEENKETENNKSGGGIDSSSGSNKDVNKKTTQHRKSHHEHKENKEEEQGNKAKATETDEERHARHERERAERKKQKQLEKETRSSSKAETTSSDNTKNKEEIKTSATIKTQDDEHDVENKRKHRDEQSSSKDNNNKEAHRHRRESEKEFTRVSEESGRRQSIKTVESSANESEGQKQEHSSHHKSHSRHHRHSDELNIDVTNNNDSTNNESKKEKTTNKSKSVGDARKMELLAAIAAENARVKRTTNNNDGDNNNNNNNNKTTFPSLDQEATDIKSDYTNETSEQRKERRHREREARRRLRSETEKKEKNLQTNMQLDEYASSHGLLHESEEANGSNSATQAEKQFHREPSNRLSGQAALNRQGYRLQYAKDMERGLMLRRLIDLDDLSVVIYDVAPQSSYDLYLTNFRTSGKVQASTQVPTWRDDYEDSYMYKFNNYAESNTAFTSFEEQNMYSTLTNRKANMHGNNEENNNIDNEDVDYFSRSNIAIQIDRVKTKNKSIQAPNDLGLYPESTQTASFMQSASNNDEVNASGSVQNNSNNNQNNNNTNGNADVNDLTRKQLEGNTNNNNKNREMDGISSKSAAADSNSDLFSKTYLHTLPSLRLFLKRVGRVMSAVLDESIATNTANVIINKDNHTETNELKESESFRNRSNGDDNNGNKSIEQGKRTNEDKKLALNSHTHVECENKAFYSTVELFHYYSVFSRPVLQIEEAVLEEEQMRQVFVLYGAHTKHTTNTPAALTQFTSIILIWKYSLASERLNNMLCTNNANKKCSVPAFICVSYNQLTCMTVCKNAPHLLLAGGVDGSVLVWDLHSSHNGYYNGNNGVDGIVCVNTNILRSNPSESTSLHFPSSIARNSTTTSMTDELANLHSSQTGAMDYASECKQLAQLWQQSTVRLPSCVATLELEMTSSSFTMIDNVDNVHTNTANNYTVSKVVFLSNVTCNAYRHNHYSSSSSSSFSSVSGNNRVSVNANNTAGVNHTFGEYGSSSDRLDINEQIFVLCKNGHVHQLCLTEEVYGASTSANRKNERESQVNSTLHLREQRVEHAMTDMNNNGGANTGVVNTYGRYGNTNSEYNDIMDLSTYDATYDSRVNNLKSSIDTISPRVSCELYSFDLHFPIGDNTQYMIACTSGVQHRSRFARFVAPMTYSPPHTISFNNKTTCPRQLITGINNSNSIFADAFILPARCLSFNLFDRQVFLAGYDDGSIRLFCVNQSKPVITITGLPNSRKIIHIEWNPYSKWLFTALDEKGTLFFYDLAIKTERQRYPVLTIVTNKEMETLHEDKTSTDKKSVKCTTVIFVKKGQCTYFHFPLLSAWNEETINYVKNESVDVNGRSSGSGNCHLLMLGYISGCMEYGLIEEQNVMASANERNAD